MTTSIKGAQHLTPQEEIALEPPRPPARGDAIARPGNDLLPRAKSDVQAPSKVSFTALDATPDASQHKDSGSLFACARWHTAKLNDLCRAQGLTGIPEPEGDMGGITEKSSNALIHKMNELSVRLHIDGNQEGREALAEVLTSFKGDLERNLQRSTYKHRNSRAVQKQVLLLEKWARSVDSTAPPPTTAMATVHAVHDSYIKKLEKEFDQVPGLPTTDTLYPHLNGINAKGCEQIKNLLTSLEHAYDTLPPERQQLLKRALATYSADIRMACKDRIFGSNESQAVREHIEKLMGRLADQDVRAREAVELKETDEPPVIGTTGMIRQPPKFKTPHFMPAPPAPQPFDSHENCATPHFAFASSLFKPLEVMNAPGLTLDNVTAQ